MSVVVPVVAMRRMSASVRSELVRDWKTVRRMGAWVSWSQRLRSARAEAALAAAILVCPVDWYQWRTSLRASGFGQRSMPPRSAWATVGFCSVESALVMRVMASGRASRVMRRAAAERMLGRGSLRSDTAALAASALRVAPEERSREARLKPRIRTGSRESLRSSTIR